MTTSTNPKPSDKKLRIAICGGRGIPSSYTGFETFFLELAPRLAARGHDVTVYCRKSLFTERPPTYRGVKLIYLPSVETKNLGTPTHTLACMLDVVRRDVDAILVANVANAFHCIIPRLFGKHTALCVDGIEWKRGKWGFFGKAYFYMNAKLCGKILPKGIITDAYAMHQLYLDKFNTPSACIAYGTNVGVSTTPDVVRQYGLEPGQYYLVLGRLVPENSADLVVEGFNHAKTSRTLAIVGDANYKSSFVEECKAIAGDRVKFLGRVNDPDHVRELYCNSYAYIHGHTVGGTNPALLHGMGYGCCVLARNNPFNKEVLGGHGVLFDDAADLAAKIEFIEQNPAYADDLRLRAPQRAGKIYSWEHIADQYEEFFAQLAAGQDPTRIHSSVHEIESKLTTAST